MSEDESYIEIDLVHKLQVGFLHFSYSNFLPQGTVEKQREQIRDLDSELSNVKADLEELKGQNDRLSTSNKVRKYCKNSLQNSRNWAHSYEIYVQF